MQNRSTNPSLKCRALPAGLPVESLYKVDNDKKNETRSYSEHFLYFKTKTESVIRLRYIAFIYE